jgi:two-component system, NarL family, nitrate/nitrite response regulator NarL
MTRLLVVAGIRLYREGLELLLAQRGNFHIVGAIPDHLVASRRVAELRPDVVLLDLASDETKAILRELKALVPEVPIVGLAVPQREHEVVSCMEAGLAGYVSRDGSLDDLVSAIEAAARGELDCSPKMAGVMLRRLAALSAAKLPVPAIARLTNREREIVQLLEQNLSNKEIATRLGIEVATAKNHVHNLLEKLNVHRRADVARLNPA